MEQVRQWERPSSVPVGAPSGRGRGRGAGQECVGLQGRGWQQQLQARTTARGHMTLRPKGPDMTSGRGKGALVGDGVADGGTSGFVAVLTANRAHLIRAQQFSQPHSKQAQKENTHTHPPNTRAHTPNTRARTHARTQHAHPHTHSTISLGLSFSPVHYSLVGVSLRRVHVARFTGGETEGMRAAPMRGCSE
jgi:hypothetical protein